MTQRLLRIAALWLALVSPAIAQQATLVTPGPPLPMTALATFLNNAFLSVGSCNSGTSAPTNGPGAAPFAGECWINTTSSTAWVYSIYDGASWVEIGTLDPATHAWGVTAAIAVISGNVAVGGAVQSSNPAPLLVSNYSGTVYPGDSYTELQVMNIGTSGNGGRVVLDGFNAHTVISFRYFNGTPTSPSAVGAGTQMGAIGAFGYGTDTINSGHTSDGVVLGFWAAQTWTDTAQGAYADIEATPIGSAAANRVVVAQFNAVSPTAVSITLGAAGSVVGSLVFANATSGTLTISPATGALGSAVLTAPAVTDTLAVLNTTQTWGAQQTLTINQNLNTQWTVDNNSSGTSAASTFGVGNGTNNASFGIGGTGYTAIAILQNRGFLNASSGGAGIVINNAGANPIIFGISSAEVGRWSGSTAGLLQVGLLNTTLGEIAIYGNTSGVVTQTVNAAAGTPTITWGTSSGTPAVTASAPLAINSTTGNITCSTCSTATITGEAAGDIAYYSGSTTISGVSIAGLVLGNGAGAPVVYGGTTCTNQALTALNASGSGTCNTIGSSYLASSLSLTTPNINVAIGTSLALGGATIGSNALAVTGTFAFSAGGSFGGALTGITTLAMSGQLTSTLATGAAPFSVSSTTNVANLNASSLNGATFAAPGSIGSGAAASGAFTTLSASSTVSGTGFSNYLASPPAIGGTAAAAGTFTALSGTSETITGGTLAAGAQALALTATQPASPTATQIAVSYTITGTGSASQTSEAFNVTYSAGYTGSSLTASAVFNNSSAGTGSTLVPASGSNSSVGNFGQLSTVSGSTTGLNVGVRGAASAGAINVGLLGVAQIAANSGTNIGVVGSAINTGTSPVEIGGWFSLNQTSVPSVPAAVIADNGSTSNPVALFQVAGVTKVQINSAGALIVSGTTIASLPTCNSGTEGAKMYVTNGVASPTFGGSVSTTGSTVDPVFCNGSGWVYGSLDEPANDNDVGVYARAA